MDDKLPKLLPCPWACVGPHHCVKARGLYHVLCEVCRARGPERPIRDEAIACWNMRAPMSAQAPRMEAWVEAVVQFVYNYEYAAQRQATSAEIANALKAHLGALQAAERGKA